MKSPSIPATDLQARTEAGVYRLGRPEWALADLGGH